MIEVTVPLQVVLLEDDPTAQMGIEQQLRRDLRTEVITSFDHPARLLRWLAGCSPLERPHVLVIDAEYECEPGPAELLARLQEVAPGCSIVILTLYGGETVARLAARMGVAGLILKKEIGLAIATAVYLARTQGPVYSAGLAPTLDGLARDGDVRWWRHSGRELPRWRLLPVLSAQLEKVAWHCLVHGMSAQLAGEEIKLAKQTLDKYKSVIYDRLEDVMWQQLDLEPLQPVMHRLQRRRPPNYVDNPYECICIGDEWAFHILTQLPNTEEDRRSRIDSRRKGAIVVA